MDRGARRRTRGRPPPPPPTDPAPPPGEAQLAVHAAEPSAEREVRLEGDVAGAERFPPGAGWKTEGEPDVEREWAGAEVEEGVAEPELEILEAVYLMRPCGIADGVRGLRRSPAGGR